MPIITMSETGTRKRKTLPIPERIGFFESEYSALMIGVEKSSISEDVNVNASLQGSITREIEAQVRP